MQRKLALFTTAIGSIIFSAQVLLAQTMPKLPTNQLVVAPKNYTIPFLWQGDSIRLKQGGSKWESNVAILIPVKLKNCPRLFYMQFDLGSPSSLLYQNKIEAIKLKYPTAIPAQEVDGKLQNFSFKAGDMSILAKEIMVKQFDSTAIDWAKKNSIEIIGTIGTDLIDNQVAIIDYPHTKLSILQQIPEKLKSLVVLADLIYANRSVLFPAKVNGKATMLYFDTGSSMFELLTNQETATQLAKPDAKLAQYTVSSWNKALTANSLETNGHVELANTLVPLQVATYMEGVSDTQVARMLKMGIGGMTGNKLLLDYILILDTKNRKFGLVKP